MAIIEGFVLAGGRSSRMGQNKAQLHFGGLTLVERAARTLSKFTESVFIVGRSHGGSGSYQCIDDELLGTGKSGSVIGLYTALLNAKSEWAAILACDLPLVGVELFIKMVSLLEKFQEGSDKKIDAILPQQPDGRLQPLCGLYRTRICLPEVKKMIFEDNWRLQDLAKRVNAYILELSEYADIYGADNCFLNVNTPDDLLAAMAVVSCDESLP